MTESELVPPEAPTRERAGERLRRRLGTAERSTVLSIAVVVYLFAASVTWAMITPIGAIPDEPAHITYSAAVVRGDLGAFAVVNHPAYSQLAVVTVPEWVASITDPPRSVDAYPFPCFGGADELTADCAPTMSQSTRPARVPTTVTRYPPPYYWIVGLPTLVMTGEPAVYAMRIVSAALAAAMVAFGLAAASPARRTWLALGAAIAFTPMVGHFAGSVNPSSFEITAALGLGIALMGIVGSERRNPRFIAPLIVTLAFALAWSRPRTYLALIAVVAAATLINTVELRDWLRTTAGRFTAAGMVIATFTAYGFQRLFTQLTRVADAPDRVFDGRLGQPILELANSLHELERRLVDWSGDLIGRFGWLDHSPPELVLITWGGLVLTLVFLALWQGRLRDRAALLTVGVGALFLAPLFIVSKVLNAFIYQARYHLSLAVLIVVGAIVILNRLQQEDARDRSWRILRWGAALALVAMFVTIAASLHRYSVGGEAQLFDVVALPFRTHDWLPPVGALLIATVGVALAAISTMLAFRVMFARDREAAPAA